MAEETRKPQWSALVVDDDPGVRQSLRLCLETEDVRVLGVGSATAAIEVTAESAGIGWPLAAGHVCADEYDESVALRTRPIGTGIAPRSLSRSAGH